ncbi:MAG: Integrase [Enhydrobacter sp.]|jgi:integrase|nr:MAG: Integrase [Enhydrobacter sp.]
MEPPLEDRAEPQKLTKRFVDRLPPSAKDVIYWDSELPRFGLRVKPSGARTFIVQYRNSAGRTRKLALGRVGVLTPEEARQRARKALLGVADGADPSAERKAQREDLTVSEAVDLYLAEGPADKPQKKASSWAIDASNLRRHALPLLGSRMVKALVPADIQRFQRDVTTGKTKALSKSDKKRGRIRVTGGAGTAWRATVVLAAMLAWLTKRGLLEANPAEGVELNKLPKRERFLSAAELARLGEAMKRAERDGANSVALNMIRVLLLTGARRTEIASLKWRYVDFEHGALRLPDSKTDEKVVPLGAPALAVLSTIGPGEPDEWVFPAARGHGYFKGMPKVWKRVAGLAGIKVGKEAGTLGVRVHDLRHGFASVAAADGDSLYLIGKVLGHTRAETTERYAHLHLDPVRAVADRTARKIAGALMGGKRSRLKVLKLVPLQKR